MKWTVARPALLAKVHKSVGFGTTQQSAVNFLYEKNSADYSVKTKCMYENEASTSLSVLEYLAVSTRVLGLKYCSTCKEVLIVT